MDLNQARQNVGTYLRYSDCIPVVVFYESADDIKTNMQNYTACKGLKINLIYIFSSLRIGVKYKGRGEYSDIFTGVFT